jgi:hypothetical protein
VPRFTLNCPTNLSEEEEKQVHFANADDGDDDLKAFFKKCKKLLCNFQPKKAGNGKHVSIIAYNCSAAATDSG